MAVFYLKDHDLDTKEMARFKSIIRSFGAEIAAFESDEGEKVALLAPNLPVRLERIPVTVSEERAAQLEDVCGDNFGFIVSHELPADSDPAKVTFL
jgi:hypothetical protein